MYPNDCKNTDNKCSSKVTYLNNMNSIWPPDWMQSIATIKMPELVKIPAKVAQKGEGENRATIRKLTRDVLSVLNSSELVQKKQVFDHAKSELEELVSKPQVSTKVPGPAQKLVSSISQETPSSKQSEKGSKLSSSLLDPNDIFTQLEAGKEKDLCLNKDRYKTELCRKFMENSSCPYGKKCQFAHGYHELCPVNRHPRYRTELCREFFIHGLCTYGTRCNFIHRVDSTESQESDSAIKFLASSSQQQQQQQQLSTQKSQSLADLNSSLSPDDSGLSINAASNSTRPYTPDSESSVDLFLTSSSSSSSSSSTRLNETMTSAVIRKPMQLMQGLEVTTHF